MAIKKEKGFVLSIYPYRETSSIVVLLTEKEGIKRGIAKGIGRKKSKTKDLLCQFSEVEVQFYEGERGQLVNFTEAEVINSPVSQIIESPCPFILSYFAEVLLEVVPEGQPNEKIYKLTRHIIENFSKGIPWQKLKIYFDFWILKLNGIFPQSFLCKCQREAIFFDEKSKDFYCERHIKEGIRFPEKFYGFLDILKKEEVSSIPSFEENLEIYRFSNLIFHNLLLNFLQKEIKSYNFLKTCDKLLML